MNNFDKLLKDKLSEHESPYSDKVWVGIEQALHPTKNKRKWGVFFIVTGLLLAATTLLWLFMKPETDTATDKTSSSITTPANSLSDNDKASTKSVVSSTIEDDQLSLHNGNKHVEKDNYSENNSLNQTGSSFNSTIPQNPISNHQSNHHNTVSSSNAINSNISANQETQKASNEQLIANKPSATEVLNTELNKELSTQSLNESSNNNASERAKETALPLVDALSPLNNQDIISLASLEHKIKQPDLSMRITEHDVKTCPRFTVFRPGFYFDLNYSVDYAIKSLTAKDIDYANYAFQRKDTESYNYSYTFSARVAYLDPTGFTAKAGLSYSQINEELNYIDPELQSFQTIITIDSIFTDGEWKETRDTTSTPEPGTGLVNKINRYKTINIPLTLAYEWRYNPRFSFFIEGGVQLNLLFNKRGEILSPLEPNTLVNFSQDSDQEIEVFNDRFSMGLIFNTGAIYHLNSTIDLYLSSGIRHHPGSLTVDNYPVYQRYSVFNIATGVRYKF